MKRIGILDTSVLSFNLGDQIIMESARRGLNSIIKNAFVVNLPTHSPLFHKYEFSIRRKDSFRKALDSLQYKFVCGTNLLEKNVFKRKNSWNLFLSDTYYINDFILVGVGTDATNTKANWYTKKFYRRALSSEYMHSTRDEQTKLFLESMGINAINTGCVTLWTLNKQFCATIPKIKCKSVIFTVTDYCPDRKNDVEMINILCNNYDSIYCWIQGIHDQEYINSLKLDSKIEGKISYIGPSLDEYNNYLRNNECDYVGTRLHAGIKAMQCGKRSIIIGVDNRARDMNETYHLNYIERKDIATGLENYINSSIITDVKINENNIRKFLNQFEDK